MKCRQNVANKRARHIEKKTINDVYHKFKKQKDSSTIKNMAQEDILINIQFL